MKRILFLLVSGASLLAQPGISAPLSASAELRQPPGLVSAELLPGWVRPDGSRMTALVVQLESGWKTYWRSPGDAGVPPQFDWAGSVNLGQVLMHWPRPEAIESSGERTLGYHDQLVLPIEVRPVDPGAPIDLAAVIDFGICDEICVPVQVQLAAPAPAPANVPDPRIEAALAKVPALSPDRPDCHVEEIADGMRVTAAFDQRDAPEVAMEVQDDSVWVSQPQLDRSGDRLTAQADFVDETGKPFALDAGRLRLTLIGPHDATEFMGCNPVLN